MLNRIFLTAFVLSSGFWFSCSHRPNSDASAAKLTELDAPSTQDAPVQLGVENDRKALEGNILGHEKTSASGTTNLFCPNVFVGTAATAKMILGALGYYRCQTGNLNYPCIGNQTPTGPANVLNIAVKNCLDNLDNVEKKPFFADTLQLLPADRTKLKTPCDAFKDSDLAPWFEVAGIRGYIDPLDEGQYGMNRGRPDRILDKQRLAKLIVAARLVRSGIPGGGGCTNNKAPGECMSIEDASTLVKNLNGNNVDRFSDSRLADTGFSDWVEAIGILGMGDGYMGAWGNTAFVEKAGIAKLALRAVGINRGTALDYPGGWFPDTYTTKVADWKWYVDYYGAKNYAQGTKTCTDAAIRVNEITTANGPFRAEFEVKIDASRIARDVPHVTRVSRLVYCTEGLTSTTPEFRRLINNQIRWKLTSAGILDIEYLNATGIDIDNENAVWASPFSLQNKTGSTVVRDTSPAFKPLSTSITVGSANPAWDLPLSGEVYLNSKWTNATGDGCSGEMLTWFRQ
jgi:hypothetical protein